LSENVAVDGGRGIFSDVGGALTVDDSTLSGNNAFLPGGAIWSTSKNAHRPQPRDFEGERIGY
jgi:hypothetical protein